MSNVYQENINIQKQQLVNRLQNKDKFLFDDLKFIVSMLRSKDGGCAWDQQQTHESIRYNFIEEVYEVIEAIDLDNPQLLQEELGDVLLQIVFHAQIKSEQNIFNMDNVVNDICVKLIERHPHVFGDRSASDSSEALDNWDQIKKEKKNYKKSSETLDAVPRTFPALMRAQKVQKRANKLGFAYDNINHAFADLKSELDELNEAINLNDPDKIREELGDLLFSCANIARFVNVESEECLTNSTDKFISRVKQVEAMAEEENLTLEDIDYNLRNEFWNKLKK